MHLASQKEDANGYLHPIRRRNRWQYPLVSVSASYGEFLTKACVQERVNPPLGAGCYVNFGENSALSYRVKRDQYVDPTMGLMDDSHFLTAHCGIYIRVLYDKLLLSPAIWRACI